MDWLEIFILGLISGLTEFLPLSAPGHQRLLMHLMGLSEMDPLCRFLISLGCLLAVCSACSGQLRRLAVEKRMQSRGRHPAHSYRRFDLKIVKSTAIPIAVVYCIVTLLQIPMQLPYLVVAFAASGTMLFIMGNMRQANKDSRRMTKLDTAIMSAFGCTSVIPGISLVGSVTSAAIVRGALRQNALNWGLLVCIPILLVRMGLDLILLILNGTALGLAGFFGSIVGAFFAYIGGLLSIRFIRFAVNKSGLSGFSYYAWGASLLTFILFLIT